MQTRLSASAIPVRESRFLGLTCAFTGNPLDVRLTVSPQTGVLYYAVGTDIGPYSTRFYPSAPALMEALSMRDGIAGTRIGEALLSCPYTGAKLRIETRQGLYHAVGGWNPYLPQPGPQAFEHLVKMRNGVPSAGTLATAPKVTVTPEVEEQDLQDDPLREPFVEQAEKMTEEYQNGTTGKVTVAVTEPAPSKPQPPKKSHKKK